jgi:hypothetical protein
METSALPRRAPSTAQLGSGWVLHREPAFSVVSAQAACAVTEMIDLRLRATQVMIKIECRNN